MRYVFKGYIYVMGVVGFLLLIIFWNLMNAPFVHGDYPDFEMNETPNPVGSGARAMGMGGAFISVADDATAASWNPGGLIQLLHPELSIVGSYFRGAQNYETDDVDGAIDEKTLHIYHCNYFSAALPFDLWRRSFVFSVNYQHLYEFSQDISYRWHAFDSGAKIDRRHYDAKTQKGSLSAISPALAIEIIPPSFDTVPFALSLGVTGNFWDDGILDNGWENETIQKVEGTGGAAAEEHSIIYERYDFSGFNVNIGFLMESAPFKLWGKEVEFRLGGVLKTPFDADIIHKMEGKSFDSLRDPPYIEDVKYNNLPLRMPMSYGVGLSLDFTDIFTLAVDVYRTRWDRYLLVYGPGNEKSPINKKPKEEADIKPTTQIRVGGEYIFHNPRRDIPIRMGAFYDPDPAGGKPDDIYGVSIGSGLTYREDGKKDSFSLDFMYQYRFGDKKSAGSMQGRDIPCEVKQHYFYTSIIFYFI